MKTKTLIKTAWVMEENPLFSIECPHCKNTMFMSKEPLIVRLKKWAKMLKDL